jgi:hypothetical protein
LFEHPLHHAIETRACGGCATPPPLSPPMDILALRPHND